MVNLESHADPARLSSGNPAAASSRQDPLLDIRASLQQLHARQQAQQAALTSFASLAARLQSLIPAAPSASSSVGVVSQPNFVDPDNLAGDLSHQRNNPFQGPAHLCDDDSVPTLFDLYNYSGVRRVKAVLAGTHAAFEIETLGGTLTLEIVEDRFSPLTTSSVSPNHRNLLNALSSQVRPLAFEDQIPSARVRTAVQALETQRAAALFKAASQDEAQKGPSGGQRNFHQKFQPGRSGPGRGLGPYYHSGRGGKGVQGDPSRAEDSAAPS